MPEDIDLGNGLMLRQLPEGSYTYPKTIPTEETDTDPFARAALRMRQSVKGRQQLPVDEPTPYKAPNYLMGPDLLEAQQGAHLPTGIAYNDAGIPFNKATGKELVTVSRPNVLPIARTPDGLTLAMPKVMDVFGNMMGGVAGAPVKGAEVLLGSGPVRKVLETPKIEGPFFSALEKAVDTAKVGKADAQQWTNYLRNQPGVKQEELSYVLKDLPEGPISKEQLGEIIKGNKVELKEVVKGGTKGEILTPDSPGYDPDKLQRATDTKYHSYQLPGGENYKEMLLTLPDTKVKQAEEIIDAVGRNYQEGLDLQKKYNMTYGQALMTQADKEYGRSIFKSSHWDEPNIIAHIRHNDRMVDGKKTLHLEEIQSDWHQKGRNEGYKLSDKQRKDLDDIEGKLTSKLTEAEIGNPDIDNVLKVAVDKKVISADEARNYKDYVKGENSTVPDAPFKKNWDELALKRMLHKAADEGYEGISWTPGEAQAARYDLSKQIKDMHYNKTDEGYIVTPTDNAGKEIPVNGGKAISEDKLADFVGKEVADKIIKGHGKEQPYNGVKKLENVDLKIGGEGMKSFYDKMLVDKANALAKKYGAKVEQRFVDDIPNHIGHVRRGEPEYLKQPIHYLPITPELRAKAKEGFPLFSFTPTTTPVSHNPFTDEKPKPKLTPVDYDPFK